MTSRGDAQDHAPIAIFIVLVLAVIAMESVWWSAWRRSPVREASYSQLRESMTTVRKVSLVATAILALALAACTTGQAVPPTTESGISTTTQPLPAVDLSVTPAGWVSVAYGNAQISVPASFTVLYQEPDPCLSSSAPGVVYVVPIGASPDIASSCNTAPHFPPTLVSLVLTRQPAHVQKSLTVLNGLPVYLNTTGNVLHGFAPSLGTEVSTVGRLAHRALDSLTRSPRSVALAPGPASPVPSSWRSVAFAGVRFSVPPTWAINRTAVELGLGSDCKTPGVALANGNVVLSTDMVPVSQPPCAYQAPVPQPPSNGVQVDSGARWGADLASFSRRCLDLHGLRVCPAISPAYSILVLRVTVPGRTKPVFVSIGLAGTGVIARAILHSLRAA